MVELSRSGRNSLHNPAAELCYKTGISPLEKQVLHFALDNYGVAIAGETVSDRGCRPKILHSIDFKGYSPKDAIKQVGMVMEGINAIPAALKLAKKYDIEIPIITAVNDVINRGKHPKQAVKELIGQDTTTELSKPILDPLSTLMLA